MKKKSQTNWKRLEQMTDNDIDYSDSPATDEEFWQDAQFTQLPQTVELKLDKDIALWIKELGQDADVIINNLLRSYFLALQKIKK